MNAARARALTPPSPEQSGHAVDRLFQQAEDADIRLTPGMAEGLARGNPRMIAYVADLISLRGRRPAIETRHDGGAMQPGKTYTVNENGPEAVVDWDGQVKSMGDGRPALMQPQKPAVVLPNKQAAPRSSPVASGIPASIARPGPASAPPAPHNDFTDLRQYAQPPAVSSAAQEIMGRLDSSTIPGMSKRPDVPVPFKVPGSAGNPAMPEANPPAPPSSPSTDAQASISGDRSVSGGDGANHRLPPIASGSGANFHLDPAITRELPPSPDAPVDKYNRPETPEMQETRETLKKIREYEDAKNRDALGRPTGLEKLKPEMRRTAIRVADLPFYLIGGIAAGQGPSQYEYQKHPFTPVNWIFGDDPPPSDDDAAMRTEGQQAFNDAAGTWVATKSELTGETFFRRHPVDPEDDAFRPTVTGKGLVFVPEGGDQRKGAGKPLPEWKKYQFDLDGSSSDFEDRDVWVPALMYKDPAIESRSNPYVRLDGVDPSNPKILIDRKLGVTLRSGQVAAAERTLKAFDANPGYKLRIETTSEFQLERMRQVLEKAGAGTKYRNVEIEIVVKPHASTSPNK